MPRSSFEPAADPLARFLGFDPARDPDCVRPDPPVASVPVPAPASEPGPPADWSGVDGLPKRVLAEALAKNPHAVLLLALLAVFNQPLPDGPAKLPGGRYGRARLAASWALRELAAAHPREVRAGGWIVGKREDPHR